MCGSLLVMNFLKEVDLLIKQLISHKSVRGLNACALVSHVN